MPDGSRLGAVLRICEACVGSGTSVDEDENGRYRSSPCRWCQGRARMSLRQYRAWLDESGNRTPTEPISQELLAGCRIKDPDEEE